jgi:hypothetical protein
MCKKTKGLHNRIDKCMKHFILELNLIKQEQFEILACCCGHGKYPMSIVIKNSTIPKDSTRYYIWELFSGEGIERTRKFYVKDKQGYYYIPEVIKQ